VNKALIDLKQRISELSDDELLNMLNVDYADYRTEALRFASEALKRRGFQLNKVGPDFDVVTPDCIRLLPVSSPSERKRPDLSTATTSNTEELDTNSRWHTAKRLAFRFAFVYLILYNLPMAQQIWYAVVPWVGEHILHLSSAVSTTATGSGDKIYDWILAVCHLTIALVTTLIWSTLGRGRSDSWKLDQWLRLYVRLSLAYWMIVYGGMKAIPSQFPQPFLNRLIEPYGESSPMGLLWTFMGSSPSYTIFTGFVELLGGVLLILPRTAMLGAVVSFAATAQVFVLNMCYDVPVKLLSFHLMLMSVFLLLPHTQRIANLFLFNRGVPPAETRPLFERKWLNRTALVLQIVFGFYVVGVSLYGGYEVYRRYDGAPKVPLYGIWSVEEVAVNGELRPPLLTDQTRWRRAIFQFPGLLVVQPMSGPNQFYKLDLNMEKKEMALTDPSDPNRKAEFSFEQSEPGLITLDGQLEGKPTREKLFRTDESQFLLRSRGFHWISEFPFNQ
jgi:uncharacterized membrane protein YphA (DoxX/SURF4 family)